MSCYVINQNEYWKMAGILTALAEHNNAYREPLLRIWNSEEGRVCDRQWFIETMHKAYQINVANVCGFYDEENSADTWTANNITKECFEKWRSIVARCAREQNNVALAKFIRTALYWLIHAYRYQSCDTEVCDKQSTEIVNLLATHLASTLVEVEGGSENTYCEWTELADSELPTFEYDEPISIFAL